MFISQGVSSRELVRRTSFEHRLVEDMHLAAGGIRIGLIVGYQ